MSATPKCPHCGYEFDGEETWHSAYSKYGRVYVGDCDQSDLTCPNDDCKKPFKVECVHKITFKAAED